MSFYSPEEIVNIASITGKAKVNFSIVRTFLLGFLAGAYIGFGFLLYIRVITDLPFSLSGLIGSAVFPLGLILVVIAGGELLTGNMMSLTIARLEGKITTIHIIKNWTTIAISNLIGAVFIAYFFGHVLGLTETGPYLEKTILVASNKVYERFPLAFISGIGANWLVCLAVWLAYAAKDIIGKIIGIWFPIMAFVAIGFQHVVANMFIIPAAIFAGSFSWFDFIVNISAVFLGNLIGGAVFVGGFYWMAYAKK